MSEKKRDTRGHFVKEAEPEAPHEEPQEEPRDPGRTEPAYHVLQAGESLLSLADGDRERAYDIWHANRDTITDPERLAVGQVIVLPE